jgi:hypothetical protein
MDKVLLAVAIVAVYGVSVRQARNGSSSGSFVASLSSLATLAGALIATYIAGYFATFKCNESCDNSSSDWTRTTDAWQWDAQLLLALGGLGATVAVVYLTLRGHYGQAGRWFWAAVVAFGLWAAIIVPGLG